MYVINYMYTCRCRETTPPSFYSSVLSNCRYIRSLLNVDICLLDEFELRLESLGIYMNILETHIDMSERQLNEKVARRLLEP